MNRLVYLIATLLTLATSVGWTKGQNLRIEITGDGLSEAIVITDPETLGLFNIWNGPGVSVRGPDGKPYPPAHLDPKKSNGRFIDWPKGTATDRPSGLQRLEVHFVLGVPRQPGRERSYIFAYEIDSRNSRGFIYLPMWMNNLIAHGIEGNWFHATERWNQVIGAVVSSRTKELRPPSERDNLSCIAGHGSLSQDGTVEFKRFDENGVQISHWRYETATEGYEAIRDHIGDVEPDEQIEVSCWPPRS